MNVEEKVFAKANNVRKLFKDNLGKIKDLNAKKATIFPSGNVLFIDDFFTYKEDSTIEIANEDAALEKIKELLVDICKRGLLGESTESTMYSTLSDETKAEKTSTSGESASGDKEEAKIDEKDCSTSKDKSKIKVVTSK